MKYVFFGDIHGMELKKFTKALGNINPDFIICTGDFDQVRSINDIINLERTCLRLGKEFIAVPGNHDYSLLNNQFIWSGTMLSQGKDFDQLRDELLSNNGCKKYISNLVNSDKTKNGVDIFLDKEKFGDNYSTKIIHAGLGGSLRLYENCPDKIKNLWFRLDYEFDYSKNFDEMKKQGFNVMVRGHDHKPAFAAEDSKGEITLETAIDEKSEFPLLKNELYTINPGALFDGFYGTIDTGISYDVPVFKYCRL